MSNQAIGVFDSGLGGLTVVAEIKKVMPMEKILYLGDTARVPYGTRSHETIVKFSVQCARFLEEKGAKIIVIACNTASAHAVEAIRQAVKIPVMEVISWGGKGAIEVTQSRKVGVIGTRATVNSHAYARFLDLAEEVITTREVACPLLVPLVEEGEIEGEIVEKVVKKYLDEFGEFHMDTLVLGCTHYPVLAKVITKQVGQRAILVNPGEYVAEGLAEMLVEEGMASSEGGEDRYFFTDLNERYLKTAQMFLGSPLTCVEKVEL